LDRRDSLVVLPTGGGKSLCFQAPALAMDGMAIVVSPLLSLMKDQVDALRANGVAAAKIDSTMTEAERRVVHRAIQERSLKLLYVSPERVVKPAFTDYLRNAGVSFVVVDEAHCISHWGHDFRPEYRALVLLRSAFPDTSVHAFTATATEHVRADIIQELGLRDPAVLIGSFDRPNLRYRVQKRSDLLTQVRELIDAHPGESGIVYCIRRDDVDGLCAKLVKAGYKALPYHAGMGEADRKKNQEAFANEAADIIVATVAFGMGIDKSNVRYVIHGAMPKSVEHYQQETGRAGRDRLEADCTLLYSYADFQLWRNIVEKNESEGTEVDLQKLQDMVRYCDQPICRHKSLVEYFGEPYPDRSCGACDVCLGDIETRADAEQIGRCILSAVLDLEGMAGPTYTTAVLTGSREERITAKKQDHLPSFSLLETHDERSVRDWIEQLVYQGYLSKTGEYNILSLTPKGLALNRGADTPILTDRQPRREPRERKPRPQRVTTAEWAVFGDGVLVRVPKPQRSMAAEKPERRTATQKPERRTRAEKELPDDLGPFDPSLFQVLRQLRREKAAELSVPPFVVFSDVALRDMARRKPLDRAAFLEVQGVGQRKCEAFGDEFLDAIQRYCEESGFQ
jgi:ATP-dependent DNA helicase RecQ